MNSSIHSVTIYQDRALVERISQSNLETGEHEISFDGLPAALDPASVQVNGSKNAILLDIKIHDVYHEEVSDVEKKEVIDKIEEIEDQLKEIADRINNTNLEKELLKKMSGVSGKSVKKTKDLPFSSERILEMLTFYSERMNVLDEEIRTLTKKQKKLNDQLNVLNQKSNKYNQKQFKTSKQLDLKLNISKAGTVDVKVSYVVMNAGWTPVYDLRLDSEEKQLKVAYSAMVMQNTGEKWDNVQLKLSTARPQVSAHIPNLYPWYIGVYQYPELAGMVSDEEESASRTMKKGGGAKMSIPEAPMQIPVAQIETGAASVVFSISGTCSVSDDYKEHKIGITNLDLDARLEYSAVPKITPFAYLTATTSNNSDFPFLPGKTNVYLDNSFVCNSGIKLVSPNEEFKTSLGIDEGIRIEHKMLNKFFKDEGIFSKKNKTIYEYLVEIKNTKMIDCVLRLKDQIPVSQSQEIRIELIEPRYKEDTEFLKKGADGIIEWILNLKSGEKTEIKLKFSVDYPKDFQISGLI